jgi:galactokinase
MTPDELPADMEGRLLRDIEFSIADCRDGQTKVSRDFLCRTRALLKAYQEQRRVLERIAITTLRDDGGAMRRLGQVVTEAQRALNQKGDER